MPTYEYACRDCGHHLEVVQSFTDDPLTECPSCHGDLRKVFSPIGISFKGSGFYKTDSRSGSSTKTDKTESPNKAETSDNAAKTDKAAKSDGSDKAATKSDAKKSDSSSSSAAGTTAKSA
jgi:putative FmdB family regulatory protein